MSSIPIKKYNLEFNIDEDVEQLLDERDLQSKVITSVS